MTTVATDFRFIRLDREDNLLPWAKQLIDTLTLLAFQFGSGMNGIVPGTGTVTSVAGGVGITATPADPIVAAGTVDLDINSLSAATVAAADLFAFVDVSVGPNPADQRKGTISDIAAAIGFVKPKTTIFEITTDSIEWNQTIVEATCLPTSIVMAWLYNELDRVYIDVFPATGSFDINISANDFATNGYLKGFYNLAYWVVN
jgi:hypothetical protein